MHDGCLYLQYLKRTSCEPSTWPQIYHNGHSYVCRQSLVSLAWLLIWPRLFTCIFGVFLTQIRFTITVIYDKILRKGIH